MKQLSFSLILSAALGMTTFGVSADTAIDFPYYELNNSRNYALNYGGTYLSIKVPQMGH